MGGERMATLTVERSIWINAPRERVWRAITQEINAWWGDDHWEFAAVEPGAGVTFGFGDDTMTARLGVVKPPGELSIEWPPQEQYHSIAMVTTYRLEEEKGGTRVTVTETGFEALPGDIRQERFDSTLKGYETVLASLKDHVEAGR
jgi:uncharacterized protein YndB with AHSA1/START domain